MVPMQTKPYPDTLTKLYKQSVFFIGENNIGTLYHAKDKQCLDCAT